MIIVLFFVALFILSIALYFLNENFWNSEGIFVTTFTSICISGVALFAFFLFFIITFIDFPNEQVKFVNEYKTLTKKIEHIDSYNYNDVANEIDKWNIKLRTQFYGQNSPWINWFYNLDLKEVDYIELKEI